MTTDELPDDREIDALLSSLDEPPPGVDVDALIARARSSSERPAPKLRWAAAIAAALAVAGAAYAAPRSPLPGWLQQAGRALGLGGSEVALPLQAADSAGVVVRPAGALLVAFSPDSLAGFARVTLTDGEAIEARAVAGSARFSSEPDRLRIEHVTDDTVDVRIPRSGARIEIRIGVRTVLVKEAGTVTTSAPGDALVGWLIELSPALP